MMKKIVCILLFLLCATNSFAEQVETIQGTGYSDKDGAITISLEEYKVLTTRLERLERTSEIASVKLQSVENSNMNMASLFNGYLQVITGFIVVVFGFNFISSIYLNIKKIDDKVDKAKGYLESHFSSYLTNMVNSSRNEINENVLEVKSEIINKVVEDLERTKSDMFKELISKTDFLTSRSSEQRSEVIDIADKKCLVISQDLSGLKRVFTTFEQDVDDMKRQLLLQAASDYKSKQMQGYIITLTKLLKLDIKKGWNDRIKDTLKEIVSNINDATIIHHSTIDDLITEVGMCPPVLEVESKAALAKINERREKLFLE